MQSLNQNTEFDQLSIQINSNIETSDVDTSCSSSESNSTPCTPIKQSQCHSSSVESSFNEDISEKQYPLNPIVNTPLQFNRVPFNSTPYLNNNSLISIVKRKPTVNFHSIEDIVYGGTNSSNTTANDSGINSFTSNQSKSTNDAEEVDQFEDKENKNFNKNDKKYRTTFTDEQKKMLDFYFNQNPYPDPRETEDMSAHLQLPENVIKVWFQNKRSRDKQRKFSRENQSRRNELIQQQQQNLNQSPLIANLQLLNQIKAAAALSAFAVNRSFNKF